jgi:hypothetical protein
MLPQKFKGALPHIAAIAIFVIISAVYFSPQLSGLKLRPADIAHHIGMSKEIGDYREQNKAEPLWTNSMFGGMPTYQISLISTNYVTSIENNIIFKTLSSPIAYIVLAMIGFYILMLCFGIDPWLAIIGSLTFGLSSLNLLYLEGGHFTKVHAITLVPPLIGSIFLAYRKNMFKGGILLAFFICLELAANHLQMTYYAIFLIVPFVFVELFVAFKDKQLMKFAKTSGVLAIALGIGILPAMTNLLTTYEYSKYTTRGKSELTIKPQSGNFSTTTENALSSNYIKEYNLGPGEIWSIIVPNAKGGSAEPIGNHEGALDNVSEQFKQMVSQQSSYWGEQSFSGGAFYFGAGMFLLFILGFIFVKDPIKWGVLFVFIISIILSLKYSFILDWFIDHFPMFNKFRDTKMILYLAQIVVPFLGLLFVNEMFKTQIDKKKLGISLIIINGIFLIIYLTPTMWFDFTSLRENDYYAKMLDQYKSQPNYYQQISSFIPELENARISIFKSDVIRSFLFILICSALVYVTVIGKLKKTYFLLAVGFITLADVWSVDKRYLNNEKEGSYYKSWVKPVEMANPIQMTASDNFILSNEVKENPELGTKINDAITNSITRHDNATSFELEKIKAAFRVLNFNTNYRVLTLDNPFANSNISYFHKSIGGYHGAKLKKYQELIDFYLNTELNKISKTLSDTTLSNAQLDEFFSTGIPVLNMLNTKYIVYNPNANAIENPHANGDCWLVKNVQPVENADEEILGLNKYDLKTTAIINKKELKEIPEIKPDSTASITMESYAPNHLRYKTKSQTDQVAVFSEIYYPAGWEAYIDGKKTEYYNADYILRALKVPAGEHSVEFKFEPKSYFNGELIAKASSVLLLLLVLGMFGMEIYKGFKKEA